MFSFIPPTKIPLIEPSKNIEIRKDTDNTTMINFFGLIEPDWFIFDTNLRNFLSYIFILKHNIPPLYSTDIIGANSYVSGRQNFFSSIIKIEEITLICDTSRIDLLTFLYFHSSEQAFFLNQEESPSKLSCSAS